MQAWCFHPKFRDSDSGQAEMEDRPCRKSLSLDKFVRGIKGGLNHPAPGSVVDPTLADDEKMVIAEHR